MIEHLKNGNALLAVSIVGMLAMVALLCMGNDFASQNRNAHRATADYSILALAIIVGAAWLATLALGEYEVLASKNNKVWKVAWGAWIIALPFAGAITYCLVGRKSRKN